MHYKYTYYYGHVKIQVKYNNIIYPRAAQFQYTGNY